MVWPTNPSKEVPGSSPPWFLWDVLKQCWDFLTELQFEDHDLQEVVLLSFDCLEGKREQYSFLPWYINIHITTQSPIRGKNIQVYIHFTKLQCLWLLAFVFFSPQRSFCCQIVCCDILNITLCVYKKPFKFSENENIFQRSNFQPTRWSL